MTMTSQAKYDHVPRENASLHPFRQLLYLAIQEGNDMGGGRDCFGKRRERELTLISLVFSGCTNLPIDL